jgi:hypothetical protein
MSMLVVVFNQTTSWPARAITYDEAQRRFILQDHGPVTAHRRGHGLAGALPRSAQSHEGRP